MTSIMALAGPLTEVLRTIPDRIAHETGCVKRARRFSGATLVQTLVLGWLAKPSATLEELVQMAAACGVSISAQGLDQRFTPALAGTLEQVLAAAVAHVIISDPVAVPVLRRFTGVYLEDSSTISLPTELASVWPGCGGNAGQGLAALKLGVRLDLCTGALTGPHLASGRTHDRAVPGADAPLPRGSLWRADLGYVTLARLRTIAAGGGYWLTRLKAQTQVVTADGQGWDQLSLLALQTTDQVELPVRLGRSARIPARLLALRLPEAVAEERRTRLRDAAARKQQSVSAERLALAGWTILVTNVPADLLSADDAFILARARWQVELLFKLWKSHAEIDTSRSQQPQRIGCEVTAKLIGVVVQHWLVLTGAWRDPARSLVKAAQVVRAHIVSLATSLPIPAALVAALTTLQHCLGNGTRMNRRRQHPNTYQLLLDLDPGGLT